jgi:FtsP/CotA-like multicopper oxidase with cupredoxin domain/plastocyanin
VGRMGAFHRPGTWRALSASLWVFAALAGVLTVLPWRPDGAPHTAHSAAAAPVGAVREFELTAREVDWELFPGAKVKAWTYNGTVPGPELRVTEGDLVRVVFTNELPVPTAVHWHGMDVPVAMDGVPGLTQSAVPPGGRFVYEFVASNVGTRWYHSHQDAELQGPLGLYGPLIVDPRVPEPVTYDREYTYTLSEWDLGLTPAVARGDAPPPPARPDIPLSKQLDYDLFLLNGKAHEAIPPIEVRSGERVRLRLINAGNLLHTMHSHGHSFKVVATDGNPVPAGLELTKDSVTLGPSERVDVELYASNPGVWLFHCHMEHHMANGMMTTLRYEGAVPVVAPGGTGHAGPGAPAAPPPTAQAGHQGHQTAPATAGVATAVPGAGPANATQVVMTDNRFQPGRLTVRPGTTVTWVNRGANVHTISAQDASFDSGPIAPGESFSYTFTRAGEYPVLCRQHLLNGMTGTVAVQ